MNVSRPFFIVGVNVSKEFLYVKQFLKAFVILRKPAQMLNCKMDDRVMLLVSLINIDQTNQ